ncbi:MAG: hypothetical protein LBS59_08255 [Puniceicoccales bacterium]|jgi:lipopolysaccharide biosynthesis glycosyltransferase|nr:hypothetical protein [Puniceicoccales bacterium]
MLRDANWLNYTRAVFGKCFVPYLLEDKRPIVLDTDILPRADISALAEWEIPTNHPFAGFRLENWKDPEYRVKNGLKNLNGGVLVWNRDRAVAQVPFAKLQETMRKTAHFAKFPDEDLLLFAFGNDWTLLPGSWNHIYGTFSNHQQVRFIVNLKPWQHEATRPEYGAFSAFLANGEMPITQPETTFFRIT